MGGGVGRGGGRVRGRYPPVEPTDGLPDQAFLSKFSAL